MFEVHDVFTHSAIDYPYFDTRKHWETIIFRKINFHKFLLNMMYATNIHLPHSWHMKFASYTHRNVSMKNENDENIIILNFKKFLNIPHSIIIISIYENIGKKSFSEKISVHNYFYKYDVFDSYSLTSYLTYECSHLYST